MMDISQELGSFQSNGNSQSSSVVSPSTDYNYLNLGIHQSSQPTNHHHHQLNSSNSLQNVGESGASLDCASRQSSDDDITSYYSNPGVSMPHCLIPYS
jgi:hypothetical protein